MDLSPSSLPGENLRRDGQAVPGCHELPQDRTRIDMTSMLDNLGGNQKARVHAVYHCRPSSISSRISSSSVPGCKTEPSCTGAISRMLCARFQDGPGHVTVAASPLALMISAIRPFRPADRKSGESPRTSSGNRENSARPLRPSAILYPPPSFSSPHSPFNSRAAPPNSSFCGSLQK